MCVRGLSACLRPGASVDRSVGEANPVRREERHSGPGQVSLTQLDYMAEAEEVSERISTANTMPTDTHTHTHTHSITATRHPITGNPVNMCDTLFGRKRGFWELKDCRSFLVNMPCRKGDVMDVKI